MNIVSNLNLACNHIAEALHLLGISKNKNNVPEIDIENTPERIAKFWLAATESLREKPPEVKSFEANHSQILLIKDIPFVSLCSHHFLPFRGVAHVAYIPDGRIMGVSKPARVIDYFAKMPQTQERLTTLATEYINDKVHPLAIAIVMKAEHTCISCRGASKPGSQFVTSKILGAFEEDPKARAEVMGLLKI